MQFLNEDMLSWNDLTDEEQGLLLLAWHKGLQIQYWDTDDDEWNDEPHIKDCAYNPFFDGQEAAFRIKPEPEWQVRWCNDYKDGRDVWHHSREVADRDNLMRSSSRIAVIRREIVDGVVSYYKEDV